MKYRFPVCLLFTSFMLFAILFFAACTAEKSIDALYVVFNSTGAVDGNVSSMASSKVKLDSALKSEVETLIGQAKESEPSACPIERLSDDADTIFFIAADASGQEDYYFLAMDGCDAMVHVGVNASKEQYYSFGEENIVLLYDALREVVATEQLENISPYLTQLIAESNL